MLRSSVQLKISLKHVKPPIWRRVVVDSSITLGDLHDVIQTAMGWINSHPHVFVIDGATFGDAEYLEDWDEDLGDEKTVRLGKFATVGAHLRYEYDFGDGWEHDVQVEKVEPGKSFIHPVCVAGKRGCPPEDCGGPWGYQDLIEALADSRHERHAELTEWVGPYFDPIEFDLAQTNELLAQTSPHRS